MGDRLVVEYLYPTATVSGLCFAPSPYCQATAKRRTRGSARMSLRRSVAVVRHGRLEETEPTQLVAEPRG